MVGELQFLKTLLLHTSLFIFIECKCCVKYIFGPSLAPGGSVVLKFWDVKCCWIFIIFLENNVEKKCRRLCYTSVWKMSKVIVVIYEWSFRVSIGCISCICTCAFSKFQLYSTRRPFVAKSQTLCSNKMKDFLLSFQKLVF